MVEKISPRAGIELGPLSFLSSLSLSGRLPALNSPSYRASLYYLNRIEKNTAVLVINAGTIPK